MRAKGSKAKWRDVMRGQDVIRGQETQSEDNTSHKVNKT